MPARPFVLRALLLAPLLAPGSSGQEAASGPVGRRANDEERDRDGERLKLPSADLSRLLALEGLELSANVTADLSRAVSGGADQRLTARALLAVGADLDLDRALGWEGARLSFEAQVLEGRDASQEVGDAQVFSNIDADELAQISELMIEQRLAGDALLLKVGKGDANNDFARVDAGAGFVHSSAGFSPTITVFPSYPDPALGVSLRARPGGGDWSLSLGAFDSKRDRAASGNHGLSADFEAAFLIGEVERAWSGGRAAVGAWHHTGAFTRFDGGRAEGAEGIYALAEQRLFGDAARGLVGFAQWGVADGAVAAVDGHVAAGLLATGLWGSRALGETGLYVSRAELTDAPGAALGGAETAVELFQELRLSEGLTLRPDLQFLDDPGGDAGPRDAWVATLRLELQL